MKHESWTYEHPSYPYHPGTRVFMQTGIGYRTKKFGSIEYHTTGYIAVRFDDGTSQLTSRESLYLAKESGE